MHYDLELNLTVYQPTIIDSETVENLLTALNKIMKGQTKITSDYSDGWEEITIRIQKAKT